VNVPSLNGWCRIGIVVSVLWIIVGGFWGNNLGIHDGDWVVNSLDVCLKTKPDNWALCHQEFTRQYPEAIKYHWLLAGMFAFIPIPLGWLFGWSCFGIARWIRRGFVSVVR
jgi:hypothetical protein